MENNLVERIACYIRVSTQEQKLHGLSLDAQRDALIRFAERKGFKIVAWYEDEGVSGRKLIRRRPALQNMLKDAESGKFDRIIFIKLDRYFRSVAEYHECQKRLDACKVTWTATEEKYDLTTASGRFWINQKISMAEYEADNTGERIRLVNDYKIKTGQPLTGAHCLGLAYTVGRDEETGLKKVIIDPETKDLCMDFINHFLTHNNKKAAVLYVNEKYGTSHEYNSLSNVLTDTKICGHYKGNDSYCEPYVTRETFDKIQELLKKNVKVSPTKRAYLFTGLIPCPICGRKLAGGCSTRRVNKKASGKVYYNDKPIFYYKCNAHTKSNTCDFTPRKSEKKLEAALLDTFDRYITDYIKEVEVQANKPVNPHAAEQVTQIKTEMSKLNTMFRKSRISEPDYDKDYTILEAKLIAAESHLKPVKARDLSIYKEMLETDWRGLYKALDRENKRTFWRKYIKSIVLDEKGHLKDIIFF